MAEKARLYAGVAITYARGADSVSIAKAVKFPGRRRSPMDIVAIDAAIQNWGIAVEDLVLSAVQVTPARGDVITFTEDGVTATYEVLPQDGDSCSHLTAGDSQHYIHTKQLT
jgi:hypothetical protein